MLQHDPTPDELKEDLAEAAGKPRRIEIQARYDFGQAVAACVHRFGLESAQLTYRNLQRLKIIAIFDESVWKRLDDLRTVGNKALS